MRTFLALLALAFATALLASGCARAPATGQEHSLGQASAPVVVEEWSDFE